MKNSSYWVGRFRDSDKVALFDPELNDPETAEVILFIPDEMALETYKATEVRPRLQKVEEKGFQLVAESSYRRWQRRQQRDRNQDQGQPEQEQLLDRLRRRMAYWQKKSPKRRRRYVAGTECYCGKALNPLQHRRCERCGWLICSDHHCGCTYRWDRG